MMQSFGQAGDGDGDSDDGTWVWRWFFGRSGAQLM